MIIFIEAFSYKHLYSLNYYNYNYNYFHNKSNYKIITINIIISLMLQIILYNIIKKPAKYYLQ